MDSRPDLLVRHPQLPGHQVLDGDVQRDDRASSSAGSSSSSGPYTSMPDFSCALSLSRPDITTCAGATLSSLSPARHTGQPGMQHAARCAGACGLQQQVKQSIHFASQPWRPALLDV